MTAIKYDSNTKISSPTQAVHLVWPGPRSLGRLYTWAIYLDTRNREIFIKQLAFGRLARTMLPLRKMVEPAIIHGASGIILINQRISPSPIPWEIDWSNMIEMNDKLEGLQIKFLDYIIIGKNRFFSMAAREIYECI